MKLGYSGKLNVLPKVRVLFKDGDGEGGSGTGAGAEGGSGAGSGAGAGAGAGGGNPDDAKVYSKKDIEEIVKKRLGRDKDEKAKLVTQLEKLQQSSTLSEQEKTELQTQIDNLNASMRTAKEQAEYEKKQLEGKLKSETELLSKDRDTWKTRFMETTTRRAITDAAVSAGGDIPEQFVMMFSGSTRLEEEKGEDGKPTGNFIPKLKFNHTDAEGKNITFDLPVNEGFLKMRELGMHKNLFKHGATPGTGADGSGRGGSGKTPGMMPNRADYASDVEYSRVYQAWRNEYNIDGTPIKKGN